MKLSIIMPVYNTCNYLKRALESILTQSLIYSEYELIIINDGSSDSSEEILREYAAIYPNIKLVHQQNQGEAKSRNKALKLVKGDYVTFIDSDDAIYPDTLKAILNYAEKHHLDLLYLNIHSYDSKGDFIAETLPVGNEDVFASGLLHPRRTFPATLYKTSLINKLEFPEGIIVGPDTVFNTKAQSFADRVSYFEKPYYQYTVRPDSLSKQGKSETGYQGFIKAIKELRNFQKENFAQSPEEEIYFDSVFKIFVNIVIGEFLMPNYNKKKYMDLLTVLEERKLSYLFLDLSQTYPFIDKSYDLFKSYQIYIHLKFKIFAFLKIHCTKEK